MRIVPTSDSQQQHRQGLLKTGLEDIQKRCRAELANGVEPSIVFIIDCEDPFGQHVAKEIWATAPQEVDAELAAKAGGSVLGSTLTHVAAYEFEIGEKLLRAFPGIGDVKPPAKGKMIAAVIAAGGVSTFEISR